MVYDNTVIKHCGPEALMNFSLYENKGSSSSLKPSAIQNTPCRPYEGDPQTKKCGEYSLTKAQHGNSSAVHSSFASQPSDLHLHLTSRSSYGHKYRSVANLTFDPEEKGKKHVTRSGSCYRRDPLVEDSIDSSPAQAAKAETPRRSIHRKKTPEFRT
ncbi:hypothetical protein RJ639_047075 [Escallonia herrerae]|uniref:Uncharacterized protein n=1 Tax=Escallonia herrerae TaxID=1293975 RepID=A0AA89B178_9ASTE|nr:hypothetical protein RJ639_047075 [Escallonia herrerae]